MNDKCNECSYTQYSKKHENMTYFYNFCVYCKKETMLGYYVDLTDTILSKNEESCEECKVNDESTINKECKNGCKL
jgi:hypothetical protein